MPSAGTMDFCFLPGGRGTRVDTHVYGGYRIPPFYDSLIAKLITKGTTRKEALMRMDRALHECLTDPVKTTAGFCQKVINSSGFKRGSYDTSFLNKFLKAKER
jgi:acetyl-CoA carboxylase biotin carboxylase subunit